MLWGTGIGQFFFSIRKQHTVNKATRVQGTCSEYFRGVVFSYSFSIYCAANHGILCSVQCRKSEKCTFSIYFLNKDILLNITCTFMRFHVLFLGYAMEGTVS